MKQHILPPLRRVEMTIDYGSGTVVEVRRRIVRPAPVPAPKPKDSCCCVVVDDSATGIIVELPVTGRDFDEYERELRRDVKHMEREYRKMAKAEAKAAKKSYKELERSMR